jgi:hypothetical protein
MSLVEVAVGLEELVLGGNLIGDGLGSLDAELGEGLLSLVESGRSDLSLVLKLGNDSLVLPSDLVGKTAQNGVLAVGGKTKNAKSLRNDDSLDLVVRRGDTLENLQVGKSGGTTGSLVGKHTTDGSPENLAGGAEVEGTATGVSVDVLLKEGKEFHCTVHVVRPERKRKNPAAKKKKLRTLVAVELARDVDALTTDGNDVLTGKELLGDGSSQAAQQVASAVNDDSLRPKTFVNSSYSKLILQ